MPGGSRAPRRYFGISECDKTSQTSIKAAKDLGQAAAAETSAVLSLPFTVQTAFADARGDGKHKRIYGFVTTSKGEDLAERLVRLGLARALGGYCTTPGGKSVDEYHGSLQDIELQAAR